MKKYTRACSLFYNTPLALLPAKAHEIDSLLRTKSDGGDVGEEQIRRAEKSRADARSLLQRAGPEANPYRRQDGVVMAAGNIALLPVFGVLSQRVGMVERASGGISTEEIGATLEKLVADRQVSSIVMVFDSPGGAVSGAEELARRIASLRSRKQIVGIADSLCASAAYWIASQCSELYCTYGGMVGSIGVIAMHSDYSEFEKKLGVKTSIITAGRYKSEGNPVEPLGAEARAEIQRKCNFYMDAFVAAVARGRNVSESTVRSKFGEGRLLTSRDAHAVGMVDGIRTLAQVLHRVSGAEAKTTQAVARAVARAVSLDADAEPRGTLQARLAAIRARAVAVEQDAAA
jgi:signal peptide peptidase SppA